jgi:hypothetical protein
MTNLKYIALNINFFVVEKLSQSVRSFCMNGYIKTIL